MRTQTGTLTHRVAHTNADGKTETCRHIGAIDTHAHTLALCTIAVSTRGLPADMEHRNKKQQVTTEMQVLAGKLIACRSSPWKQTDTRTENQTDAQTSDASDKEAHKHMRTCSMHTHTHTNVNVLDGHLRITDKDNCITHVYLAVFAQ